MTIEAIRAFLRSNPVFSKGSLFITLFLFLSILTEPTFSQGRVGTISGFVRDESNGESLSYANVILEDEGLGSTTNQEGYYVITGVTPGRHLLKFSYLGYATRSLPLFLKPYEAKVVNVSLTPRVLELGDVKVSAERQRKRTEISISNTTFSRRQLRVVPQIAEADLFRSIQLMPGVITMSDFSAQLIVRGGSPDQNLILLDGISMYNPFHMGGVFSTFNVDAIKEAKLLKGGFPAQYGGRLSSVLNVLNKEGNSKEVEGRANISLLSAKSTLEGPIFKGAWLVSARRTYFDQIFKATKYEFPYYFYDLQGKLYQNLSHNNRVTLSGYFGDDVITWDDLGMDIRWGNRTLSANWRHIFSSQLYSNFMVAGSKFYTNAEFGTEDVFHAGNTIQDRSIKGDLTYYNSREHTFNFGYILKDLSFHFFAEVLAENDTFKIADLKFRPFYGALYFQDKWNYRNLFILQPGIRLDYFKSDVQRWRVGPRLAAKYLMAENTYLKGSWGIYYQFLNTFNDEENFAPLDFWLPLDKTITPGRAVHYILGLETVLPFNVDFEWEVYFKRMDNLIMMDPKGELDLENIRLRDLFSVGGGHAYGTEVFLKKETGPFTGWMSYALAWTRKDIDTLSFYPRYDRRHNFNAIFSYRFNPKWEMSARGTYGTGFPYTRALGRYQFNEFYSDEPMDKIIGGIKNNYRYPDYRRVDLSLSRHFNFKHWSLTLYLEVINLLNWKNVFYYDWDFEENPAERETVTMFPRVPTAGISAKF